jgi:transcriptional regulator with XRE-family HTH domain
MVGTLRLEETMELRDYLHFERMQVKQFAEKIGYDRSYISKISEHGHIPSKRLRKAITDATDGKVTFDVKQNNDNQSASINV